jgi:hypothetical protein
MENLLPDEGEQRADDPLSRMKQSVKAKSKIGSQRADLSPRDKQWMDWLKKHDVSDESIAAFLAKYPPDPAYITCRECGKGFTLTQDTVRFWPDHLWAGKVQAWFRCPDQNCLSKNWIWAHDLPAIWQMDAPALDWEKHDMRRLLYSCSIHGIMPLPEPITKKSPDVEPPGWFERLRNKLKL